MGNNSKRYNNSPRGDLGLAQDTSTSETYTAKPSRDLKDKKKESCGYFPKWFNL